MYVVTVHETCAIRRHRTINTPTPEYTLWEPKVNNYQTRNYRVEKKVPAYKSKDVLLFAPLL